MVRRSLFAAAFFLAAAPLTAQNQQNPMAGPVEYQWSSDRPDARAPAGTFGSHMLEDGEIEISYRYHQRNWQGIYFRTDSVNGADVAQLYDDVPLGRTDKVHQLRLEWGLSQNLTLLARGRFAEVQRETIHNFTGGPSPIRTTVQELGDTEFGVLYNVYSGGPYRMHVQGGVSVPTGKAVTYGDTTRARTGAVVSLPYDMRTGTGTFGMILGIAGNAQNEMGSVGAQFRLRTDFGENDAGYKIGDLYEANGWAAYKMNDMFSFSGGIRWERYGPLEGFDASLNPFGDPHNAAPILSGQRAHLPLGVNFRMPDGQRFAGHGILAEAVYTLHHDMDGPQLGMDWGFNFGYTFSF